ncbi:MAG: RDD family protein, partial [Pyrinomonadaceae bacterium]
AVAVLFWTAPFAAILELLNFDWVDLRVSAALAGIGLSLVFLYFTISVALRGQTWGMSLLSLHIIDARTGEHPAVPKCVARTILFMLSFLTLGIGFLFVIFDLESRAAHDYLSGTRVIKY